MEVFASSAIFKCSPRNTSFTGSGPIRITISDHAFIGVLRGGGRGGDESMQRIVVSILECMKIAQLREIENRFVLKSSDLLQRYSGLLAPTL